MAAQPDSQRRIARRTDDHASGTADRATTAEASITLRVPRGAMGDLTTGAREVLAAISGVETVDVGEVHAVRPTSFDIYVDVTARLRIDETADPDTVRERLLDGFGIEAVEAVVLDVG